MVPEAFAHLRGSQRNGTDTQHRFGHDLAARAGQLAGLVPNTVIPGGSGGVQLGLFQEARMREGDDFSGRQAADSSWPMAARTEGSTR